MKKSNKVIVEISQNPINTAPDSLFKISDLSKVKIVKKPVDFDGSRGKFSIYEREIRSKKFPGIQVRALNPVELYLHCALNNLNSINYLESQISELRKNKDYNSDVEYLIFEEFQFCVHIVTALEAYINQIIPSGYKYKDRKGIISKTEIERYWSITDKLKKIIPKISNVSFSKDLIKWKKIINLINLRNESIHLKKDNYSEWYRRLLDNDFKESYQLIADIISITDKNIYNKYKTKIMKIEMERRGDTLIFK